MRHFLDLLDLEPDELKHLLDDATATNFSTYLTPRRAQDFQDLSGEWASSALDRRQRFTFSPIYDWRPFKNRSWMMKNVIGNWTIAGTAEEGLFEQCLIGASRRTLREIFGADVVEQNKLDRFLGAR